MALYTIKNQFLSACIESKGAELRSLKGKNEYMWSANPEYWARVSPILFPFIGKTYNMQYHINGECRSMSAHGFARDMEFSLLSQSESEIWFYLEDNDHTFAMFPFKFRLEIGYKLNNTELEVLWRVINPSNDTLPFAIGGHPAFLCPADICKCYFKLDRQTGLKSTNLSESGLALDEYTEVATENGYVKITKELMDSLKTILFENNNIHEISLCGKDKKPYITVSFDAPVVALWTPEGKDAPFLCIEPWYGSCDREGYTGDIKDRAFENLLEANGTFNAGYKIKTYL